MPTPEAAEAAPLWAQIAGAFIAIGSLCGMIVNGFRAKRDEKADQPASHMVVEAASLADTRPFRDILNTLVAATDRNVATNESIRTLTERGVEANEAMLEIIAEWVKEEKELRREKERDERADQRIEELMRSLLHGGSRRKSRPDGQD